MYVVCRLCRLGAGAGLDFQFWTFSIVVLGKKWRVLISRGVKEP